VRLPAAWPVASLGFASLRSVHRRAGLEALHAITTTTIAALEPLLSCQPAAQIAAAPSCTRAAGLALESDDPT